MLINNRAGFDTNMRETTGIRRPAFQSVGDYACPHCGEMFLAVRMREGENIPTHDFPKPCRSVCPGTGLKGVKQVSKEE